MHNNTAFYSQNGEDFLLWSLFKGKPEGFYIDVGAFDGVHLSNSYFFELMGWAGVCVEAHPKYYSLCKEKRPASICLEKACVGTGSGPTVTFNAEDLGLFSGVKKEAGEAISRRYNRRNTEFDGYKEIKVGTVTLNELAEKYAPESKKIDFISIDTEGNEYDIIKDFNFDQWLTRVIIVEANDREHAEPIIQLMQRNGYVLSRVLQMNYFFTRHQESAKFLRYKRINCRIADVVHPLGENVTPSGEKGRVITDNTRWITPNVLCQQRDQPLWSLLDYFPGSMDSKKRDVHIVHVVNPYPDSVNPVSGKYQKLTYDSMATASKFDGGEITLVSAQSSHDDDLTPAGFERSRDLDKLVTDFAKFSKPQPLPLLFDILERGSDFTNPDDFMIFTNSDIILMPHFYSTIRDLIGFGFDAMNICRRTTGDHSLYCDHENLARSEIGDSHPGSDCFVFSKRMYEQFIRNNCCIGKMGVTSSVLYNMAANAERMIVLRNTHLTYHIGDDRSWISLDSLEYKKFNDQEFQNIIPRLTQEPRKKELVAAFSNTYWSDENLKG